MKVGYDHTINMIRDRSFWHNVGEIRKASFIIVTHMHTAVEHYVFTAHRKQKTATAHILAGTQWCYFDVRHFGI